MTWSKKMREAMTKSAWVLALIASLAAAGELRAPKGFRPAPNTKAEPYTGAGWAREVIHQKTGIEMVFIPAGEFLMGSPGEEKGRHKDEGPQRRVPVQSAFYMGKFEVTQGQWTRWMGSNPSWFKGDGRLPVEGVRAEACQDFLAKLNAMGAARFSLPTEAEWEYACRAGTTTPFASGQTLSPDQANCNGEITYGAGKKGVFRKKLTPVGSFAPNAWGLCDMHGNVWERCRTSWKPYPYAATDGREGPRAKWSALRGGSWYCRPGLCRSANRYPEPAFQLGSVGLRVVCAVKP